MKCLLSCAHAGRNSDIITWLFAFITCIRRLPLTLAAAGNVIEEEVVRQNISSLQNGNCLLKISGIRDSLKEAERRLADYMVENPHSAIALTMEELAKASGVSYATIYRFAKRLGYPGFKELRSSLARGVVEYKDIESQLNSVVFDKSISTESICAGIYEHATRTISDCISIIDTKVIDEAVKLLMKARYVYCIGAGSSYVSSLYAYSRFFRSGIRCGYEPSSTFYTMQCKLLTDKDVLFAISSSGRTKAVVNAVREARGNNAKVIGLTDFAVSPLSRLSDVNLHTTPRNVGAFLNLDIPLVVGQITTIDILHLCCCARMGERAARSYAMTREEAEREKS